MYLDSSAARRRYLMCPPAYFTVRYRINPWMYPDRPVSPRRAMAQWQRLHDKLTSLGHRVELIAPQPDLPDMVFAANGGILIGDRALVARFRFAERQGESNHFAAACTALGIAEVAIAQYVNEGEGDFRLFGNRLLAGTGPRSDPRATSEVAAFFGLPVVRLTLLDPRFYHLDTALAWLDDDTVAYWPDAFDDSSQAVLRAMFPDAIVATADDAAALGLNIVSDGTTVLMNPACEKLADQISDRGFTVEPVTTDELRKAGGGAKCCVLEQHRPPAA